MTPEMEALGRRALEAGFQPPNGARARILNEWMRVIVTNDGTVYVSELDGSVATFPKPWLAAHITVDVGDAATLGTLIAQAREALGEPCAYAGHINGEWYIDRDGGGEPEGLDLGGEWGAGGAEAFICEPSEPAAWVAALEAAGRRNG